MAEKIKKLFTKIVKNGLPSEKGRLPWDKYKKQ